MQCRTIFFIALCVVANAFGQRTDEFAEQDPSPAIREFRELMNLFPAIPGESAGPSGSRVHGSISSFRMIDWLDARNFFALSSPPYTWQDFDASLSAPVIPNRLFVFGAAEVVRLRRSETDVDTVPGASERLGIMPGPIYDPGTYVSSTGTRLQFPKNTIPRSRLSPIAQRVLSWYPLPQTSGVTANYVYQNPQSLDSYSGRIRADYVLNAKQSLFFRYGEGRQENAASSALPLVAGIGYVSDGNAATVDAKSFSGAYTRAWTPSLNSSLHVDWNNLSATSTGPNQPNLNRPIGLQGVDQRYTGGLAAFAISGLTPIGGTGPGDANTSQSRRIAGDFAWQKRSHTIAFGAQALWLQTNLVGVQQSEGQLAFTGIYTQNPASQTGGSGLADFLLGNASSGTLSNSEWMSLRQPVAEFFVQDVWRVRRHLTLDIGVRYELNSPPVDRLNKMADFDLDSNADSPSLVLAKPGNRASRALQNMDHKQFAPRFGFAWSMPDEHTVLRGSYEIFYPGIASPPGMQALENNPPNHAQVQISPDPTVPAFGLANGFPAGVLTPARASNVVLVSWDRSSGGPMTQMWDFNIQHQLPAGILIEAGYYGNKLDHALRQFDGNPASAAAGSTNANRRFQSTAVPGNPYGVSLADVIRLQKDGYSNYNALGVRIEKRYSKSLALTADYSYSKTMALGNGFFGGVQNASDWAADRAVSSQDMTHRFTAAAVYDLPFGHGRTWGSQWNRFLSGTFGGWSVSPVAIVNTGLPLNLSVNGNPSNTGQGPVVGLNDRPDVVGNWHPSNPGVQQWFNTAAFAANAPYTFGNAGAWILRAPGRVNLDLAASKTFAISERVSVQLRFESFNATNTPPLGAPNTQVGNPLFGQITSAGPARDNRIDVRLRY